MVLTLLAGSWVAAGCGKEKVSEVNMQEAAEQSDGILDNVLHAIQPQVRWTHGPTTAGSCEVSRRRTIMTVISAERRGSFLGLVDRHLRRSGYQLDALNSDTDFPAIYARTEDGYKVSLRFGGEGQAFLRVDSPCVAESEVAESTTRATAPTYEGMEHIPRPNIRSPFWSAGAP
ncbi:hypothetical protein ACFWXA_21160 [Streptomyces atroolivaceus]|uniref:hypothetical protein n=1 Tax=Streptomyces atroolivaceus TaxID=66869 RepID=UPI00364BA739